MKRIIYYFCFILLVGCIVYGPQASFDIADSKRLGVFIAEYTPEKRIIRINDTIQFDIKEIWLEYDWGYDMNGSGTFYKRENVFNLYVLMNGKINDDEKLFVSIKMDSLSKTGNVSRSGFKIEIRDKIPKMKKIEIILLKSVGYITENKPPIKLGSFYIYLKEK